MKRNLTEDEKERLRKKLIEKWDCVLNPLSANNNIKAILIEPQERWHVDIMNEQWYKDLQ